MSKALEHKSRLAIAWRLALFVTIACFLFPVKYNVIRYGTVGGFVAVYALSLAIGWRYVGARIAAAAIAAALIAVTAIPGHAVAPKTLRDAYVSSLTAYTGDRYIWGGETPLGIDCSGLIRRGLIDADLRIGFTTLNMRPLRDAFAIYWRDCTAEDLGKGYNGRTERVATVRSLNYVSPAFLQPGDIAVTAGGQHVLAYLGGNHWIDADPRPMRVDRVTTPAPRNPWFNQGAVIMRWRVLA